jgi:hypothetical protein
MAFTTIYVWQDLDAPEAEMKFGDHFCEVDTLEQAFTDTQKYIRGSLGRQKHKFDEGRIVIHKVWDATEYAKLKGRFGKHQKIDDVIRPVIGHHVQADVHRIDADTLIERVNKELIKHNQPLPLACLSQNQHDAVVNVQEAIALGKRTIIAELAARFGKTIWSGSVIRETNKSLTIIASYVLTSFASFRKDLTSFEQFRDFELIDAGEIDWEDKVLHATSAGLQAVVFLSMCNGSQRQDKIDFLFNVTASRMLIVDEADYGVHQFKQSQPLIDAHNPDDIVILMTGTNADKAASVWHVDHYLSVTYPELLIEKKLGATTATSKLKHFQIDTQRHQLVVDVEFYQMNLASIVDIARTQEPEAFSQAGIFLPSWSKFAAMPVKAKGFFTNMLQAVFEGKGGDDSLNVDFQTGRRAKEGTKVAMMFLPGSTTNTNLQEIKPIAEQALRGFNVILVSGAEDMSNATAEREVKEAIETAEKTGQHVLILSAGMAQRSFSIPQITELYLCYDTGDNGATIQKMSRTLTPHKVGKIGRVVSLSFDPNRDDKFDAILIETAQNYMKNKGIADLKTALAEVLRTVDIFKCQQQGSVKVEVDTYLEQALARKSIDRVIGKIAPVDNLDPTVVQALSSGKIALYHAAMATVAAKGKTRNGVKAGGRNGNVISDEKALALAREMIATIAEHSDIILYYGGNTFEEAFNKIDKDGEEIQNEVTEQFGVDYELIKELILTNFINRDLLDLKYAK